MANPEHLPALTTIFASKSPISSKPRWRMACQGLNVEGKCQNSRCEAFASRVRCHKGFGVFNVRDAAQCPICHQAVVAIRIGFIGCQWVMGIDFDCDWTESRSDEYRRFGLEGARQPSLVVATRALPSNQVRPEGLAILAETCAENFETLNLTTSEL